MVIKNRKFNVAGVTFYEASFKEGTLVFFRPEPENPEDENAIQVLNGKSEIIGHVPRESALEILSFMNGKFPFY